jgi:hypothetical protein
LAAKLEIAGYRDVEVHEGPVDIPFRSYMSFVDGMMDEGYADDDGESGFG